jgi:1-acyl-sn-glycerol-3-phosphate acyltransferase
MEAVLIVAYAPWQIEMLGAADIPHEKITQIFSGLFGFIPINRGHVDRPGMRASLNVLQQNGIIGIFPEGGIWEPGLMRAQTGVAWLSYHGKAPVLPIGVSGTLGSLAQALKGKRPKLTMKVGCFIPPILESPGTPRKILFENFSEKVMDEVRNLLLPDDPSLDIKIKHERFKLELTIRNSNGVKQNIPQDLAIINATALTKLLHRPTILKIFKENLQLPIDSLENLDNESKPRAIADSLGLILNYIKNENPYFLSYRFGPKAGESMLLGLGELHRLSNWADENGFSIEIIPIWKFVSIPDNKEVIQTKQGSFRNWM